VTTDLPHPLGLTADQFAAAWRSEIASLHAARDRYAHAFRTGDLTLFGQHAPIGAVNRLHTSESGEGTVLKFTQWVAGRRTDEKLEIESVLIPMIGKRRQRAYTLCVSSQVGCAMGCGFCQTAQMGLLRSLQPWEIVQQWFVASELLRARRALSEPDASARQARGSASASALGSSSLAYAGAGDDHADHIVALDPDAPIRNIVFMGMGEPMDNLDAVMQAISVLTDPRAAAMAPSRITVSTVGRIDGITRFADYVNQPGNHRIGLAISLNASNDQVRSQIMPVNRAMPLAKLREALLAWPFYSGKHLCLEYVLIPGVNDAMQHADELAAYVKGRDLPCQSPTRERGRHEALRVPSGEDAEVPADAPSVAESRPYADAPPLNGMVNIIPYNPREGSPWPAPTEESVDAFVARLTSHGVYTKRRRTKGRDQMAACGQLGNLAYRRKPVVAVSVSKWP
jgi:23S rRNA (adenine2503-C2)-methyltransferase